MVRKPHFSEAIGQPASFNEEKVSRVAGTGRSDPPRLVVVTFSHRTPSSSFTAYIYHDLLLIDGWRSAPLEHVASYFRGFVGKPLAVRCSGWTLALPLTIDNSYSVASSADLFSAILEYQAIARLTCFLYATPTAFSSQRVQLRSKLT